MKFIPLTQGKFAIVDDEDYEWLMQWKWYCEKHNNGFRAGRTATAKEKPYGPKGILMHRLIMGAQKGQLVDHRNHNGLDNRHNNMRLCNSSQNCANRRKNRNCSSKYKGITWSKRKRKWIAQITHNYKNNNLGEFAVEIEAAKAYDQKAKELFGDFAYTNFKKECM